MARRKKPSKKRPARSRSTRSTVRGRSDVGWLMAIGVCVLLIIGGLVGSQTLMKKSSIDGSTLCHAGGPINVTVILLDLTDPLNDTQQRRLKTIVNNEISSSSTDTMVSLGVVSEDSQRWGARFAKCKPATGEQANALYENPAQIAARYRDEFFVPINARIEAMLRGVAENQSPIIEALQSLIAGTPDFSRAEGQRKIVIVSDMLQHSDTLSFYRGQGWDYFAAHDGELRLAGNLAGVSVEILRIPRGGDSIPPRDIVEDFWARYFDRQGSRPPSVRSLGDL